MFCQGVGCLIGGLQKHNRQTVLHRQNIPLFQAQLISASRFYIINGIMRKRNLLVHGSMFSHYKSCEQFCNTGWRKLDMDILGKQHCS